MPESRGPIGAASRPRGEASAHDGARGEGRSPAALEPAGAHLRPTKRRQADCAVLCSAGLDSAVLVAHLAQSARVLPLYVSVGLAWEAAERACLARLMQTAPFADANLANGGDADHAIANDGRARVDTFSTRETSHRAAESAVAGRDTGGTGDRNDASPGPRVQPPLTLTFDMRDVYPPTHWAIRGEPPAFDTPDEDVYLAGRNVVLLTKAGVCAASRRIPRVAIGPLAGNPFPDATPRFFDAMGRALSLGLDHPLTIEAPFAAMDKPEVIRLGVALGVDLGLTMSCMNPQGEKHCGRCSKCRERRDAFHDAGVPDPTAYANPPLR